MFLKRQVRWSGIPISFRIFQFIVIHTVKGFGIVNKAEIDVFLELFCLVKCIKRQCMACLRDSEKEKWYVLRPKDHRRTTSFQDSDVMYFMLERVWRIGNHPTVLVEV